MRKCIAYLLGSYPRWSETFLRQDLSLLQETDVPLLPLCVYPGDAPAEPDWPRVTCLSTTATVSVASAAPDSVQTPAQGHQSGARIRVLGSRLLPRRLRTPVSLWSHRRLLAALCSVACRESVGHIHAEFADLPGLLAAAASQKLGCSYSVGIHARDIYACKYSLGHLFSKALFVTACNAAAGAELLRRCPALTGRLHVVPHGILLDQWPFNDRVYCPRDPLQILFVGRFVEKKGIEHLLRALAGGETRQFALTLVGSGPGEAALRELASSLEIEASVTWAGVIPRRAVPEYLRASDCLVVPSVVAADGDRDGIPNVAVEAMAAGVPVVATTVGGIPEAISDHTGWPCRAGDPEDLRRRLSEIRQNPRLAEAKRRTARTLVESRFDARCLARRRAELLRGALGDEHAGTR